MKSNRLLTISLSITAVFLISVVIIFNTNNTTSIPHSNVVYPNEQTMLKTPNISYNPNSSQQSSPGLVLDLGGPLINKSKLIYDNAYVEFVSSEKFFLTIHSPKITSMELSATNVPKGVWIKFVPESLQVGSNGTSAIMLISGAVKPFVSTNKNTTLTIVGKTSDNTTPVYLPIVQTENMTILNDIKPINFANPIKFNQNGTASSFFGVVYDPSEIDSQQSLSVNFSVVGMLQDGKILPLPYWLKMDIPVNQFLLNPFQPYYFLIGGTVSSAPLGTYIVVVDETINGQHFMRDLQIDILPQIRT